MSSRRLASPVRVVLLAGLSVAIVLGAGGVATAATHDNSLRSARTGLLERLRQAGFELVQRPDGTAVLRAPRVYGPGNDRQLQLAEQLARDYGVMSNPFFDPSRSAYYEGNLYDLNTGVSSSGGDQLLASDALLNRLRRWGGWSPETAYAAAVEANTMPGGYVPVAFQSQKAWQNYINAARANYLMDNAGVVGKGGVAWPRFHMSSVPDISAEAPYVTREQFGAAKRNGGYPLTMVNAARAAMNPVAIPLLPAVWAARLARN